MVGGALNALAIRRGWLTSFNWLAAVVTPVAVGLLVLWSAA